MPGPGDTVKAWMWPADFGDLIRGGRKLTSATVHQEQRGQFLIPVEIRILEPEVVVVEELELPKPKRDPGEPPLHRARKRYHAIYSKLIQNPWERDDTRHAFHAAHPDLPDDERNFGLEHYQKAIQEVERRGWILMAQALKVAADGDPADPKDVTALEELLEAANPEANPTKRARWVVEQGVGKWVRRELDYQTTLAAA